jgi:hypothetical protein
MDNSLDALEQEAAARRKKGRQAGEPRFPRKPSKPQQNDDATGRAAEELQRRDEERRRRREADTEAERSQPEPPPELQRGEQGETQDSPEVPSSKRKRARPTSMPFYPNPEHEAFLWSVTEAGAARQLRIPATAVLRLALSRLEEQMTPSEIVRELGNSVQPEGKMGRPRL